MYRTRSKNLLPHVSWRNPVVSATLRNLDAQPVHSQKLLRLGFGGSPFPPPKRLTAALVQSSPKNYRYEPTQGLEPLRGGVAEFQNAFTRYKHVTAKDVVIGPGTKELIFLVIRSHGQPVYLPSPTWVSYAPQALLAGLPVHWVPTRASSNWKLTPESLDAACSENKKKGGLLILASPNNPTGSTYLSHELHDLAEVARKHDLVVLSDEIYRFVTFFRGKDVAPCASFSDFYDKVVVSTGPSKMLGVGGWRLGALCFSPTLSNLRDGVIAAGSETFSSVSSPVQHAALDFYGDRGFYQKEYQNYARRTNLVLQTLLVKCWGLLKEQGLSCSFPTGGFYLWVSANGHAGSRFKFLSSEHWACDLEQRLQVQTLPGRFCGRAESDLALRFALVDFDGREALRALESVNLGQEEKAAELFVQQHCNQILERLSKIVY